MKICKVISGNKIHNGSNSVVSFSWLTDSESNISNSIKNVLLQGWENVYRKTKWPLTSQPALL